VLKASRLRRPTRRRPHSRPPTRRPGINLPRRLIHLRRRLRPIRHLRPMRHPRSVHNLLHPIRCRIHPNLLSYHPQPTLQRRHPPRPWWQPARRLPHQPSLLLRLPRR
jgi:hypothetical protein